MRLMLAPRSANALHVVIPVNSHGIRNRPGSPSFFGFKVEDKFRDEHQGHSGKAILEIKSLKDFYEFLDWSYKLFPCVLSFISFDGNGIDALGIGERLDVFGASVISRRHRVLCHLVVPGRVPELGSEACY
ncbi:hypothetical protein Tco_1418123 [Tanacetum coccineum]